MRPSSYALPATSRSVGTTDSPISLAIARPGSSADQRHSFIRRSSAIERTGVREKITSGPRPETMTSSKPARRASSSIVGRSRSITYAASSRLWNTPARPCTRIDGASRSQIMPPERDAVEVPFWMPSKVSSSSPMMPPKSTTSP